MSGEDLKEKNELVLKPEMISRMVRALMVYKNWIWRDGIEIAKLRTRMKRLEKEVDELNEVVGRISTRSEN